MLKWLDRLALLLSILAASVQVLLVFSINLSPQLRTISFIVLIISIGYTLIRITFNSSTITSPPEQITNIRVAPSENIISSADQAYKYLALRYGAGYDSLEIKWSINEDGSALLQRIIEIESFSIIESLDTYLLIPESDKDRKIKFGSVDSLSPRWNVTLSDIKSELGRGSALITISPPLKKEEKMRYSMVEQLPTGLYAINLTNEELSQRQLKYDYCGWNINRPTRKVSLQVEFPKYIKPEVFSAEVRYASTSGFPSSRSHHEESQRFSPVLVLGPHGDRFILRLDIDYPMIGLIYILRWQPVARDISLTNTPNSTQDNYLIIHNILIEKFNEEELRTIAGDLNVNYDSLLGKGQESKARELVSFLELGNQIPELIRIGKQQRPDISWPEQPD